MLTDNIDETKLKSSQRSSTLSQNKPSQNIQNADILQELANFSKDYPIGRKDKYRLPNLGHNQNNTAAFHTIVPYTEQNGNMASQTLRANSYIGGLQSLQNNKEGSLGPPQQKHGKVLVGKKTSSFQILKQSNQMSAFKNSQIIESHQKMSELMSKKQGSTTNNYIVREAGGDNYPGQYYRFAGESSQSRKHQTTKSAFDYQDRFRGQSLNEMSQQSKFTTATKMPSITSQNQQKQPRMRSMLNDYLPTNALLYLGGVNDLQQKAYQFDYKQQLKNNNLLKNLEELQENDTVLSSQINGLKIKSRVEVLQYSEGIARNQKPQAIIGDIHLHTKKNFKRSNRNGYQRLASLGTQSVPIKNETLDVSEDLSPLMNKSGVNFDIRQSLSKINYQRANMNRTTMNFINQKTDRSNRQNDDLVSIDSSLAATIRPDHLSPKQSDIKYMGVYQSVAVPGNKMGGKESLNVPQSARSPRAKDVNQQKQANPIETIGSIHTKGSSGHVTNINSKNSTFASSMVGKKIQVKQEVNQSQKKIEETKTIVQQFEIQNFAEDKQNPLDSVYQNQSALKNDESKQSNLNIDCIINNQLEPVRLSDNSQKPTIIDKSLKTDIIETFADDPGTAHSLENKSMENQIENDNKEKLEYENRSKQKKKKQLMKIDEPSFNQQRVDQATSPVELTNTSNFQKSQELKTDKTNHFKSNLNDYGPDTQHASQENSQQYINSYNSQVRANEAAQIIQLNEIMVKNENSADNVISTPIIENKTLEIYTEESKLDLKSQGQAYGITQTSPKMISTSIQQKQNIQLNANLHIKQSVAPQINNSYVSQDQQYLEPIIERVGMNSGEGSDISSTIRDRHSNLQPKGLIQQSFGNSSLQPPFSFQGSKQTLNQNFIPIQQPPILIPALQLNRVIPSTITIAKNQEGNSPQKEQINQLSARLNHQQSEMTEQKNINSPANDELAEAVQSPLDKDAFNSESHTLHFQTFASNGSKDIQSPQKLSPGQQYVESPTLRQDSRLAPKLIQQSGNFCLYNPEQMHINVINYQLNQNKKNLNKIDQAAREPEVVIKEENKDEQNQTFSSHFVATYNQLGEIKEQRDQEQILKSQKQAVRVMRTPLGIGYQNIAAHNSGQHTNRSRNNSQGSTGGRSSRQVNDKTPESSRRQKMNELKKQFEMNQKQQPNVVLIQPYKQIAALNTQSTLRNLKESKESTKNSQIINSSNSRKFDRSLFIPNKIAIGDQFVVGSRTLQDPFKNQTKNFEQQLDYMASYQPNQRSPAASSEYLQVNKSNNTRQSRMNTIPIGEGTGRKMLQKGITVPSKDNDIRPTSYSNEVVLQINVNNTPQFQQNVKNSLIITGMSPRIIQQESRKNAAIESQGNSMNDLDQYLTSQKFGPQTKKNSNIAIDYKAYKLDNSEHDVTNEDNSSFLKYRMSSFRRVENSPLIKQEKVNIQNITLEKKSTYNQPPTGALNSDIKMSPRISPSKRVVKKQTEELVSNSNSMKKRSDFNLLMLENSPIVQTQFLNSQVGNAEAKESNRDLIQAMISPNVAGELLAIQESFKTINQNEPSQNSVAFTKTVPLKIVQLHQSQSKDQNISVDQSSADYNESKSQYHDKAFKGTRKKSTPFINNATRVTKDSRESNAKGRATQIRSPGFKDQNQDSTSSNDIAQSRNNQIGQNNRLNINKIQGGVAINNDQYLSLAKKQKKTVKIKQNDKRVKPQLSNKREQNTGNSFGQGFGSDYLNQQQSPSDGARNAGMFASFSGKQVTAEISKQRIRNGESSQEIVPFQMKPIGSTLHTIINRRSDQYQQFQNSSKEFPMITQPTELGEISQAKLQTQEDQRFQNQGTGIDKDQNSYDDKDDQNMKKPLENIKISTRSGGRYSSNGSIKDKSITNDQQNRSFQTGKGAQAGSPLRQDEYIVRLDENNNMFMHKHGAATDRHHHVVDFKISEPDEDQIYLQEMTAAQVNKSSSVPRKQSTKHSNESIHSVDNTSAQRTPRQFNQSQISNSGIRKRNPQEVKNEAHLYQVSSSALKYGKTVYKEQNAYRTYRKVAHKQVDEILETYYNSKANLQGQKHNKWQKSLTNKQDQLEINTQLDIVNVRDGSPLRARNPKLVEKLLNIIKPGKGNQQEYSMKKWEGPTVKRLEHRRSSQGLHSPSVNATNNASNDQIHVSPRK